MQTQILQNHFCTIHMYLQHCTLVPCDAQTLQITVSECTLTRFLPEPNPVIRDAIICILQPLFKRLMIRFQCYVPQIVRVIQTVQNPLKFQVYSCTVLQFTVQSVKSRRQYFCFFWKMLSISQFQSWNWTQMKVLVILHTSS